MSERGSEGGNTPEKISNLRDLESLVGRKVSVNPVGGGPENPHVLEGKPRVVGNLRKLGNDFWIDYEEGIQQITEWFLPHQDPQVEE